MAGSEFFTVGLKDKVTGPSEKMGRAALKLERQLSKLERSRQVKTRLDLGAQRLALSANRISRERAKLASRSGSGVGGLALGLGGLAIAATAASVAIGGKLAGSIAKTADLASRSKLAFTAMLGGAEKASAFTERALNLANRYGTGLEDTFANLQNSLSAGFDRKQSEGILAMAADMRFLGATSEGVGRAIYAINQIKTAGVLQGDEVRQLAEIGGLDVERVYQRIGERMGIAAKAGKSVVQQVKALQGSGGISALTAINSIAEVIQSKTGMKLGAAGAFAASNTTGGLIDSLSTRFETGLFRVGQESAPALVKGLQAVLGGVEGVNGELTFKGLTDFMKDVGLFLENVGPKIPSIADNFVKAFSAVSGVNVVGLNSFADRLPQMATNLGQIAGYMTTISGALLKIGALGASVKPRDTEGSSRNLAFLDPTSPIGDRRNGTWDLVKHMFGGMTAADRAFMDQLNAGKRSGTALSEGVAGGISSSNAAEKAATGLAKSVSSAVDKELKIHSPSRVGFEKGQMFDQGIADGVAAHDLSGLAAREKASGMASATEVALRRTSMNFGAETEAAAAAIASGRSGNSVAMNGDINISIDGKGSTARETAQETLSLVEDQFSLMLERLCQQAGA